MLKIKKYIVLSLWTVTLAASAANTPAQLAIDSKFALHHPVWANSGMVATQEALASQIGVDILAAGGNAVDAAVAIGYALAVTLPRAGNLGGGGFMMIYLAKEQKTIALDYREIAPAQAARDMFLDQDGNADSKLSRFHGLAVGTPGTVMGMEVALNKYGTMKRSQVMQPAIDLAANGIVVTADLASSLKKMAKRLGKWPSSQAIFYKADGGFYQPGERLVQSDLAASLKLIAAQGAYLAHNQAWVDYLAAGAADPSTMFDGRDDIEPTWREAEVRVEAAVTLLPWPRIDFRISEIFADESSGGTVTAAPAWSAISLMHSDLQLSVTGWGHP